MVNEIVSLINLKQEGEYWDFKREWYTERQKTNLLHDIICFSNNLANRDCYIIIGVDEENDFKLCDVSSDANRKNTQKIVDFLKDKKFAGGIRPLVFVKPINLDGVTIDVIIVKNRHNTPFYLTENFEGVFSNNIYTRVADTNTPINRSADINHIEYLWQKRFHINETPLNKFLYYLQQPDKWQKSPIYENDIDFYTYAPEFTLKCERDDTRDGYEYYLFSQTDPKPHWYNLDLKYYQTVLQSFTLMVMDGGRWTAIAPDHSSIMAVDENRINGIYYSYYIKSSLKYILHCYYNGAENAPYDYSRYMETMLLFDNEDEKKAFEEYVYVNNEAYNNIFAKQKEPYMPQLDGYNMEEMKKEYRNGMALKIMLEQFREKN